MASKLATVAIVGQTNVGKSSLFNRLVRSQQAIVAREAGTTRDNVIGKVKYEIPRRSTDLDSALPAAGPQDKTGRQLARYGSGAVASGGGSGHTQEAEFWLVDTAGLKDPEDEFEASIQEQIQEAADAADVILVVVDSTKYPTDEDRLVAKKALKSKKPVILVINKVDLKGTLATDEYLRLGIKTMIRTSAEHARGISSLVQAIATHIPKSSESEPDEVLRIALVGRPNVGKSHLFNSLAGKQQALVANVAGTTRDVNRVTIMYHSKPIELLDTAGVRRQGKIEVGIEKFSVLRTIQAIEESDICLLLMDVQELNTQLDQRLAGMIADAGKGMIIVVSKWDSAEGKDAYTRDALAPQIATTFKFTPWAPLIFTSAVTGQNVTKIFELAQDIYTRRKQTHQTAKLNKILAQAVMDHPPAGLKNTLPKLRYVVQTDTNPPWFVIHGSNLKLLHWSYKRFLERRFRDELDYTGTAIKFSFRQEEKTKEK